MSANTTLQFGKYDWLCSRAQLSMCPMLGVDGAGLEPICYARNIEFNQTLIFQPATSILHIIALGMVIVMILHVRSKYTAVGRKEILTFFYLYFLDEVFAIFIDSTIIPTSSSVYPWFAAIYFGLCCATFWALVVNGFVGFQLVEDGTPWSLWPLRLSCLAVFLITGFVSVATYKSLGSLTPTNTTGLWILMYIFNLACVVIYIVSQFFLVVRTLDDRWPLIDIVFGIFFFTASQLLLYAFSNTICEHISHYIDGVFFSSLTMLFSVMVVYHYWDSITKEDLEFSVGAKTAAWVDYNPLQGKL